MRPALEPAGAIGSGCNTYIITVPTPIDAHKRPNLTPLIKASEAIGTVLTVPDFLISVLNLWRRRLRDGSEPIWRVSDQRDDPQHRADDAAR